MASFLNYTKKEMHILFEMFREAKGIPNNPCVVGLNSLTVWYSGIKRSSIKLARLIDGRLKYEDLPLYVPVKNEYFDIFVRWRFRIGK